MTIDSGTDLIPEGSADIDRRLMPPPSAPKLTDSVQMKSELSENHDRAGADQSKVCSDGKQRERQPRETLAESELSVQPLELHGTGSAIRHADDASQSHVHKRARRLSAPTTTISHGRRVEDGVRLARRSTSSSITGKLIDLTDEISDQEFTEIPEAKARLQSPHLRTDSSTKRPSKLAAVKQKVTTCLVPKAGGRNALTLLPRLKKPLSSKQDSAKKQSLTIAIEKISALIRKV